MEQPNAVDNIQVIPGDLLRLSVLHKLRLLVENYISALRYQSHVREMV